MRGQALEHTRVLSPADAIAVVLIAAATATFLDPSVPGGLLALLSVALIYAAFRTTRGLPVRRRAIAVSAVMFAGLALLVLLNARGY